MTVIVPVSWLFSIFRAPLGTLQEALAEEIETPTAVHPALDLFELVHLSFNRTIPGRESQSSFHCQILSFQTLRKRMEIGNATGNDLC